MKLYKYIKFCDNNYWQKPIIQNGLYFAKIDELRNVNDKNEFYHTWECESIFFSLYRDFNTHYNTIYENTRILCMTGSFNEENKRTFLEDFGGVCFEFDFNSTLVSSDILNGAVVYTEGKEFNVFEFIMKNIKDNLDKSILKTKDELFFNKHHSQAVILSRSEQLKKLVLNHVTREIPMKKLPTYAKEAEYRFIQVIDHSSINTKAKIDKFGFLGFEKLGLTLTCIHTTDSVKVSEFLQNNEIKMIVKEM